MDHDGLQRFDGIGVVVDHLQLVAETTQNALDLEQDAVLGVKLELRGPLLGRHVRVVVVAEIDARDERRDGLAERGAAVDKVKLVRYCFDDERVLQKNRQTAVER